jgi:hypothetical protein
MTTLFTGFLSGALAGALMGIISHICFRRGLFKSSLIIVDGSFFFRNLNVKANISGIFWVGFTIHLVTSGVFGAIYGLATGSWASIPFLFPAQSLHFFLMAFYALYRPAHGRRGLTGRNQVLSPGLSSSFSTDLLYFYYIA